MNSTFHKIVLLSILMFIYATTDCQQYTLNGKVIDHKGLPVYNARIFFDQHFSGQSDVEGCFSLSIPENKTGSLIIIKDGFRDHFIDLNAENTLLDTNLIIYLEPVSGTLPEIRLTDTPELYNRTSQNQQVIHIDQKKLFHYSGGDLIKALAHIPGVQSMDIGQGMSKPVIRGMGFFRVAVAESGIKLEGQHWSSHHGISVDASRVKQLEVIKGPGSMKYGTDALGGLINLLPQNIPAEDILKFDLNFISRSNTRHRGLSGDVTYRKNKWYAIFNASYNSFGDFAVAETDSFLLPAPVSSELASHKVVLGKKVLNTAGENFGFSLYTGVKTKTILSSVQLNLYDQATGFFDWEGLKDDQTREKHAENYFDILFPWQKTTHFNMIHRTEMIMENDKMEIVAAWQTNLAREFSFLTDRTGNRVEDLIKYTGIGNLDLSLNLSALNFQASYTFNRIKNLSWITSFSNQIQIHRKDGYNHILPDYKRWNAGLYTLLKYSLSDQWSAQIGARADYASLEIEPSPNPDPAFGDEFFNERIAKIYSNFNYSGGLIFIPDPVIVLKVHAGQMFRIPSVYELSAYGMHRHEGRFEKGNADVNPERGYHLEVIGDFSFPSTVLTLNPFISWFTNYLYLNPTPELRPEGQVYEYRQNKALLTGLELSYLQQAGKYFRFSSGLEYVYAVNLDLKRALPAIPPLNLTSEIMVNFPDWKNLSANNLGFEVIMSAGQKLTVPNELTTPGYTIFGLHAGTTYILKKYKIDILFKINNIANTRYFNHISFYRRLRIPEPGRDMQLIIRIPVEL